MSTRSTSTASAPPSEGRSASEVSSSSVNAVAAVPYWLQRLQHANQLPVELSTGGSKYAPRTGFSSSSSCSSSYESDHRDREVVSTAAAISTGVQQTPTASCFAARAGTVRTGFTTSEDSSRSSTPVFPRSTVAPQVAAAIAPSVQRPTAAPHTGFTTSEDSSRSSTPVFSRSADAQQVAVAIAPFTQRPAAAPHTGFTTSEDSSRSSSATLSRAGDQQTSVVSQPSAPTPAHLCGAVISAALQAASNDPHAPTTIAVSYLGGDDRNTTARTNMMIDASRNVPGVDRVALHQYAATYSVTPLCQPRKADSTPRRKVAPAAGVSHKCHDAGRTDSAFFLQQHGEQHPPKWSDVFHAAMPPSTLIDLQSRLDILTETQLRIREEELCKELARTRLEMVRRGVVTLESVSDRNGRGLAMSEPAVSEIPVTQSPVLPEYNVHTGGASHPVSTPAHVYEGSSSVLSHRNSTEFRSYAEGLLHLVLQGKRLQPSAHDASTPRRSTAIARSSQLGNWVTPATAALHSQHASTNSGAFVSREQLSEILSPLVGSKRRATDPAGLLTPRSSAAAAHSSVVASHTRLARPVSPAASHRADIDVWSELRTLRSIRESGVV